MPEKGKSILKFNYRENSMKILFVIYESLLEKTDTCHSNLKKSTPVKMSKHTACGYSLFVQCLLDTAKDKQYCRSKDCMKTL